MVALVWGDWIVTLVSIVSMQIKDPGVEKLSQMADRTDNCDESGAQAGMSGGWHIIMLDEQEHLSPLLCINVDDGSIPQLLYL